MSQPESGTSVPKAGTGMLERMRAAARLSLRKKGPKCTICLLPASILGMVRQLHDEGLPLTAICEALKTDGRDVRSYSMTRHFREHEQR